MELKYHNYDELPIGRCIDLEACNAIEDDFSRSLRILSVLTGNSTDEIEDLAIAEFARLNENAAWIAELPKAAKPQKEYRLGNQVAVCSTDIDHLTAAQYIDFQEIIKAGGFTDTELLTVILVPKGHVYGNGYDMAGWKQTILDNLPTSAAVTLLPFFVASLLKSTATSLTSSARRMARKAMRTRDKEMAKKAMMLKAAARSLRAGGGARWWTR